MRFVAAVVFTGAPFPDLPPRAVYLGRGDVDGGLLTSSTVGRARIAVSMQVAVCGVWNGGA
jgi:hypothetical protein